MTQVAPFLALSLKEFIPYRLSIASNAVSKVISTAYGERFAITVPEWRLVAVLHELASASQTELVALTLMDKVAVSRAALTLTTRALVSRKKDADDGRARRLSLTSRGRRLYRRIAPSALKYESELLKAFSEQEIGALRSMLSKLTEAAEAIIARDGSPPKSSAADALKVLEVKP